MDETEISVTDPVLAELEAQPTPVVPETVIIDVQEDPELTEMPDHISLIPEKTVPAIKKSRSGVANFVCGGWIKKYGKHTRD